MRGDARKRLEAQRQAHPDPAVRELLARAWEEGRQAGSDDALYNDSTTNPYRTAS